MGLGSHAPFQGVDAGGGLPLCDGARQPGGARGGGGAVSGWRLRAEAGDVLRARLRGGRRARLVTPTVPARPEMPIMRSQ